MNSRRSIPWLLLAVLALLVCGAGSGCQHAYPFPTAKVVGRITYRNKAVPNGTVMFVPNGSGPSATGEINPDGTYTLTTYEAGDGAVIDKHRVSITALAFRPNALPEEMALPPPIIPDKYLTHLSSGLTADVREQDENVVNFDLTD